MAGALAAWMVIVAAGSARAAGEPLAAPAPSAASPTTAASPMVITWTAPEGCPSDDQIQAEVRRMAGPAATVPTTTEAHATVRRDRGGSWQLTLTTRAGALVGERKLSASDCAELGRAAALVIALMINPAADLSAAPPLMAAASAPAATPSQPPPPPRTRRFALGADLRIGSGDLPAGTGGVGARFAIGGGAFSAQARGDLWLPRDAFSAAKPSAGGSFDAADLSVAGCATARSGERLAPAICGGAAVIGAHATGSGITNPGAATAISAGAFVEGALRVRVTAQDAVRLGAEALAPFERPTFALAGVGPVFRPAALSLRASLGWELNF